MWLLWLKTVKTKGWLVNMVVRKVTKTWIMQMKLQDNRWAAYAPLAVYQSLKLLSTNTPKRQHQSMASNQQTLQYDLWISKNVHIYNTNNEHHCKEPNNQNTSAYSAYLRLEINRQKLSKHKMSSFLKPKSSTLTRFWKASVYTNDKMTLVFQICFFFNSKFPTFVHFKKNLVM